MTEGVSNGGAVPDSKELLAIVRKVSKPYRPFGWKVGSDGLRLHSDTGHWAHFWLGSSEQDDGSLWLNPRAGTAAPYLLRTFNGQQRPERAPTAAMIGVHSSIGPLDRRIPIVEADRRSDPFEGWDITTILTPDTLLDWLERQLESFLPRLAALSSNEALLEWLTDPMRLPSAADLRYGALLAYHLRLDEEMEVILSRASEERDREDVELVERGIGIRHRSDRQTTYPQDWSHRRFVRFVNSCPRD